ncbi:diguanylate cyclase [Azoarcus olearius]|uniref:putative bifunctional diguanylate cyclase/phosphodiesterase n=1 Tax=Azoarcus sp. (strain BH72) TaxID=418699 RepID=UPI0008061E5E|nr:GGDEF domain-containing phosphodiesterase [Azoarcus olearius]ANQ84859.1 diguanylate cyclase [Azoarcus olearius]
MNAVRAWLARVHRNRFPLLALIVFVGSLAGVMLLSSSVGRIASALPLTSLYKERDFAALLTDVLELEAKLELAAAAPTPEHLQRLAFGLDMAFLRQRDNAASYGDSRFDGVGEISARLDAVLEGIDASLQRGDTAAATLVRHVDEVAVLRSDLQRLNDAVFQRSMQQASAQRAALDRLGSTSTAMIVLLGAFGLGLVAMLLRQQGSIKALEERDRELRRGEAVQRELRERLEKIADNVPGVIYQFRCCADGHIEFPYASRGLHTMFGITPEVAARDGSAVLAAIHPDDREVVAGAIRRSAETLQPWVCEYRIERAGGGYRWMSVFATPQRERDGATLWHGHCHDVSSYKAAEDEIRHLAFYDPLTGLPNRRLLMDRLRHALATHARSRHHGALLFIDLDNFKTLNDTQGHQYGDMLLRQVAARLSACVREADTVARLGGDEFVVMLEDLDRDKGAAARQAESAGEKILAALNDAYQLDGREAHSTPSIGITLFDAADAEIAELLKRADLAMYQAKEAGRNTLRFFDPVMQATVDAHSALESELRRSLRQGNFALLFQPQLDRDGRMTGAEALVRWHHPEQGLVSPAAFIPLAERTGLILPLGRWVLENACDKLAEWAADPETAHLTLAVNVSVREFRHPGFCDQVERVLQRTGVAPGRLKLELTESLLLEDVEDAIERMDRLKRLGVGFSLDDFGTGYSSLAYLKRLPLDQLKIDRSFVRDVMTDPNDAIIARTIIALGQSLGLDVLAEGVETAEQHDFLLRHGCQSFQGYLFGRPHAELGHAGRGATLH